MNLENSLIQTQAAIMTRVDRITEPNDAVFDGIGIAVTRKKATPYSMTARWRDERQAGADYDIIGALKESQPTVMIWSYRMGFLRDDERDFISAHFVPDWANICVVGATATHTGPEPTFETINLLSSAQYAVIAKDRQRICIDGKVLGPVEFLSAGDHEVVIDGDDQELQLKYFPAVNTPPPPPQERSDLFPSYSE